MDQVVQTKTPKQTVLGNEAWSEGDRELLRAQAVSGLPDPGQDLAFHSVWEGKAMEGFEQTWFLLQQNTPTDELKVVTERSKQGDSSSLGGRR